MHDQDPNVRSAADSRAWAPLLARYRPPSNARGTIELLVTALPLALLWILTWAALRTGCWLCLLLAVPAAGLLVRLFLVQHDCGHGSLFHPSLADVGVVRAIRGL